MTGMTSDTFDEDAEDAFVESVVDTSNGTIAAGDVVITNVTDVNVTAAVTRRLAAAAHAVKISYTVTVIIEELGLAQDTAFAALLQVLSRAVDSTQMQARFNELLGAVKQAQGLNFTAVSFQDLVVDEAAAVFTVLETLRPSSAPTQAPQESETSGQSVMVIWLSVVVVVVLALGLGAFIHTKHKAKKGLRVGMYGTASTGPPGSSKDDNRSSASSEKQVHPIGSKV